MEEVRPWCGQPSDRGWLRNRTILKIPKHPHKPTCKCKLSMENCFDRGQEPTVRIIGGLSTPLNLSDGVRVCDTSYTDCHDYFFQAAETANVNWRAYCLWSRCLPFSTNFRRLLLSWSLSKNRLGVSTSMSLWSLRNVFIIKSTSCIWQNMQHMLSLIKCCLSQRKNFCYFWPFLYNVKFCDVQCKVMLKVIFYYVIHGHDYRWSSSVKTAYIHTLKKCLVLDLYFVCCE